MNLYLLRIKDGQWDYDEPRQMIVVADTPRRARQLAADEAQNGKFLFSSVCEIKKINLDREQVVLTEAHEG